MAHTFEIVDYVAGLRRRRVWILSAVLVAGFAAGGVSSLRPKQYEATVRVLIQWPDGGPESSPTLMSPHYLESLQTYALIATGGDMQLRALAEVGLQNGRIRAWVPPHTRILDITAEASDPRLTLALARYVAGETVRRASEAAAGRESRETLEVIDRGAEPTRAASPRPLFNAFVAMALALVAALLGVAIDVGLARDEA